MLVRAGAAALPVAVLVEFSATRPRGVEIAGLWLAWSFIVGYTGYAVWLRPLAPRLPWAALASAGLALIVASLVELLSPSIDLTRADVFAAAGATFVAAAWIELAFARTLGRQTRILIVGAGEDGSPLVDELRRHPTLQASTVRMVDDDSPDALATSILTEQPNVVVAARDATEVVRSILDSGLVQVRVISLHGFYEHVVGRVHPAGVSPTWFMSVLHLYQRPYSRLTKRAFDCLAAVTGLVCLAPFFAFGALSVRLSGAGSILYRQVRLGEGGRPFEILKFRTMVEGAESPGAARWAEEHDPRVTWAGRILRLVHIDELPQLWNVLRGEMSLVGPRPERPEFLSLLEHEVPFWTRRHLVKPGITGWAQVQRGYASDVASAGEKLSYDLYYLKHRSLALDLAIVVKTVVVTLRDLGAACLRQAPTRSEGSVSALNGSEAPPHAPPNEPIGEVIAGEAGGCE
jgi:exopolysaccharide biosynthesis polyprenyl glycosylphosphotransferase